MLFIMILFPVMFFAQEAGRYLNNSEVSQSFKERYFSKGEQDFFPMHVGDLWQYVYYDHDEQDFVYPTEKIVKDTMALGHRYFVRYRYWPHNNTTYETLLGYYRVDSNGVLRVLDVDDRNWNGIKDEELLGDSLDVLPETSYLSFTSVYPDSHIVRDTLWRVIGNDTLFTRKIFVISGEQFYTDKIGLTMIWPDQSGSVNLTGAIINGVTYGTLVGIENEQNGNQPAKFELLQNYPNPFNPTTTINYVIARSLATKQSHELSVRLTVYDILGRKVATLVNERQAPGNYSVQFDASRLSSGIYFYRLTTPEFSKSRKMILLK